jgi:hypothetical protein
MSGLACRQQWDTHRGVTAPKYAILYQFLYQPRLCSARYDIKYQLSLASGRFKGRHFTAEVILWAVRWFPISYRDLELMLQDRGVSVDHTTIFRWIQSYAAELEETVQNLGVKVPLAAIARDDRQPQRSTQAVARSSSLAPTFRPAIVHPQVLDGLHDHGRPVYDGRGQDGPPHLCGVKSSVYSAMCGLRPHEQQTAASRLRSGSGY